MGIMWSKCLFAWLQSVRMFETIEINVVFLSARCGWTMNACRKQIDLGFKLHKRTFFPFTDVAELLQSLVETREDRYGWSATQDVTV